MLFYFAATLFLSALLLFLVQPMIAKMTLPLLGGTPAVWNTCMVFFQAILLLGYLYAHLAPKLGVRRQALVHLVVLLLPFLVLPISIREWGTPPGDTNPIPWFLLMLSATVGLPFFVVSTTAPLLQTWFANTGHPAAKDPYFLYAASNLGSMVALLGYPLLMEPMLRLVEQSWVWLVGYGLLVLGIAGCAFLLWRAGSRANRPLAPPLESDPPPADSVPERAATPVTWARRLRWVALSFVPSSLLLGFTTYLTTDIAAVPLLWVVPLALYLLTFILVFARRPLLPHWLLLRITPMMVLPMLVLLLARAHGPMEFTLPINLLGFFLMTMVCHGELAHDRPDAAHLTEFYLLMSVGGVLGGLFNALIAPLVFTSVLEYPLVLVLGCFLMPRGATQQDEPAWKWEDLLVPLGIVALGFGALWLAQRVSPSTYGRQWGNLGLMGVLGAIAVLSFPSVSRPIRFGLCLVGVCIVGITSFALFESVLLVERSFFGVHRVIVSSRGEHGFHELVHGNTSHGKQSQDPARRNEPMGYYFRTGPLGDVFAAFNERPEPKSFAVIGLGSGGIAAYLEKDQSLTFYEIDPLVERIARDRNLFTFLRDAKGRVDVVLGDGRLTLATAPEKHYGMLIVDAFSSDAIPMHLLTREAIQLYLSRLRDDAILVFHISNRYLALEPVLGDLAGDLGLSCRALLDGEVSMEELELGKMPTHFVVMARKPEYLGRLAAPDSRWYLLHPRPGVRVWTDDFSNILSVLW